MLSLNAACWSSAVVSRPWYRPAQGLLLMPGSSVLFCWGSAFPDKMWWPFHVERGWQARAFRLRAGHLKISFSRSSKSLPRWLFLTWFRNLMQSASLRGKSFVCVHKCQWQTDCWTSSASSHICFKRNKFFNIAILFIRYLIFMCFSYFQTVRLIHRSGGKRTFLTLGMYCLESVYCFCFTREVQKSTKLLT